MAAGRCAMHDEPLTVALCRDFGMQAPPTDWPAAALSWLGEGGDPGQAYWLQADPVHLVLQRDSFSLGEPVPLPLDRQQAETLLAALNRHFAADGLRFHLGRAQSPYGGRWYLQLPTAPDLKTSLPQQALGRDIRPYLPRGTDAGRWQQLGNEIQMLLHEHSVNQAREAAGEPPVNSLWFSAGGVLPGGLGVEAVQVFSNMPLLVGLARVAGCRHRQLPANAQAWLAAAEPNSMLTLDALKQAELDWFAPLLGMLRRGRVRRLELCFAARDRVLSVQVHGYDLFRFWRPRKPLTAYFQA